MPVSHATITLLNTMVEAAKATDGRFDPTVLPALIEAGYQASIDDADRITTLSPGAPPKLRRPRRRGDRRRCPHGDAAAKDVAIDPGGIGKGLAADLVAEQLVLDGAAGDTRQHRRGPGGRRRLARGPRLGEVEVEDPHDPSMHWRTWACPAAAWRRRPPSAGAGMWVRRAPTT